LRAAFSGGQGDSAGFSSNRAGIYAVPLSFRAVACSAGVPDVLRGKGVGHRRD